MPSKIEFIESTGNVFADLGLEDADNLRAKNSLAHDFLDVIEK